MKRKRNCDPLAAHTIIIDAQEKTPLRFPAKMCTTIKTLETGDYSIDGFEWAFAVERKTITDLVGTLKGRRACFEREMERMAELVFARVLVEGSYQQFINYAARARSMGTDELVGTVHDFEVRYGVPFVFAAGGAKEAAQRQHDTGACAHDEKGRDDKARAASRKRGTPRAGRRGVVPAVRRCRNGRPDAADLRRPFAAHGKHLSALLAHGLAVGVCSAASGARFHIA